MQFIALSSGKCSIIDDEDYDLVSQYHWHITIAPNSLYAQGRKDGSRKIITMHRLIMGFPKGMQIDHINGDGLDNRKINLRICTASQNSANRHYGIGRSKYKGVYWNAKKNYWEARIQRRLNGKRITKYLGCSRREDDAARMYDAFAPTWFGEYAKLNLQDGRA